MKRSFNGYTNRDPDQDSSPSSPPSPPQSSSAQRRRLAPGPSVLEALATANQNHRNRQTNTTASQNNNSLSHSHSHSHSHEDSSSRQSSEDPRTRGINGSHSSHQSAHPHSHSANTHNHNHNRAQTNNVRTRHTSGQSRAVRQGVDSLLTIVNHAAPSAPSLHSVPSPPPQQQQLLPPALTLPLPPATNTAGANEDDDHVLRPCSGVSPEINFVEGCSLADVATKLNLCERIWKARLCTGFISPLAVASATRCQECQNFWHNRGRYLSAWRKKRSINAMATVVISTTALQRPLWQEPADVRADILECFGDSITDEERSSRLSRIARHLRVEPEMRSVVNPTTINSTSSVVFCDADDATDHKCLLFTVKQTRYGEQHLCGNCYWRHNKYKQHHYGQDTTTTMNSASSTEDAAVTASTETTPVVSPATTILDTNNINSSNSIDADASSDMDDVGGSGGVATDGTRARVYSPELTVHASSRARVDQMSREALQTRCRNQAVQLKLMRQLLARVHAREQKLSVSAALDGNNSNTYEVSEGVENVVQDVATTLVGSMPNQASLRTQLQTLLTRNLVTKLTEQGEHTEEQIHAIQTEHTAASADTIDLLVSSIETLSLRVDGKDKLVRYPPLILKLALSLYASSVKGYKQISETLPLPSISSIVKIKQSMKSNEDMCGKLYTMARERNTSNVWDGMLVMDEMKLQSGILFTTSDHSITGFTEEAITMEAIGAELLTIQRTASTPESFVSLQHPLFADRRIFLFFCATHGLKSMRNALHASRPNGTRALQFKGMDISWLSVIDLYVNSSSSDMAARTNLTSEALSPDGWSAMRVRYAKAVFSDQTVLEGIHQAEKVLQIQCPEPTSTEKEGFLRSERMRNHFTGLLIWRVEYLMREPWPAHTPNPLPTLLYMAQVGAIYNNLLMCSTERISRSNVKDLESFLAKRLQWFCEWRANTRSNRDSDDLWSLRSLATVTWMNLRTSVCGFVSFAKYLFRIQSITMDTHYYLPVLLSNSSLLESYFAQIRGVRNHTKIDPRGYQSSGTLINIGKAAKALETNNAYDAEDCGPLNTLSYKLPSLRKSKTDENCFNLRLTSLHRALQKPDYRMLPSDTANATAAAAAVAAAEETISNINRASLLDAEMDVEPVEADIDLFSPEQEDEYDGEDDLVEISAGGESIIVHYTVPANTDVSTALENNNTNSSSTSTSAQSRQTNTSSRGTNVAEMGALLIALLYSEHDNQSLLEVLLHHKLFVHYYRLSQHTDYEHWFTSLFVSMENSNHTPTNILTTTSSYTNPTNTSSANNSAILANDVEKWLISVFRGIYEVVAQAVQSNRVKHLSRIVQDYITRQKANDLRPGSSLSQLNLPPATVLHLDIVYRIVCVLVEYTFQIAIQELYKGEEVEEEGATGGQGATSTTITTSSASSTSDPLRNATNTTITTSKVTSMVRALTEDEKNDEFINFVGYAIFDCTRAAKESKLKSEEKLQKLVPALQRLRGSKELLGDAVPRSVSLADRGNLTYPHPSLSAWGKHLLSEIRRLVNARSLATNSLKSAWQVICTDEVASQLFAAACSALSMEDSMLPTGMVLSVVRAALTKKVFHARSGAIFRKVADLFTRKATVHLRERLKGLSADKQSKRKKSNDPTSRKTRAKRA